MATERCRSSWHRLPVALGHNVPTPHNEHKEVEHSVVCRLQGCWVTVFELVLELIALKTTE